VGREVIDRVLARGNVELIVRALQDVHTVLSFLAVPDVQLFASIQINLLDACIANGVKRFAPSEWATCEKGEPSHYKAKAVVRDYLREVNSPVKKIEYTLFQPGFFTNYLATTRPTTKHFHMQDMFIDFANRRVLQVDEGQYPFALTTVEDTAEIAARALELPDGAWPEIGGMCGQRMTVVELVKVGEELRGPFQVDKVPYDEAKAGTAKLLWVPMLTHHSVPEDKRLQFSEYVTLGYMLSLADGGWNTSREWNEIFPDYKFTTAEEYVRKVWGQEKTFAA
jgi:hypothetical protein